MRTGADSGSLVGVEPHSSDGAVHAARSRSTLLDTNRLSAITA